MIRSVVTTTRKCTPIATQRAIGIGSSRCASTLKESYDHILVERRVDSDKATNGVGLITLNRPKALNALCDALFDDLIHAGTAFNEDEQIGSIVLVRCIACTCRM